MIRVLHVIGSMNRGGAETMIMNIYRNVCRNKIQFDFVVHTNDEGSYDKEIEVLGGKIYHCPKYNGKNHLSYVKWWKNFYKYHSEYKIVHGHIGSTAAIYLSVAKKNNIFTIAHSHSEFSFKNKGGFLYWFFSYPTRYIANYFFACSTISGISRYGKNIIKKENFKVIKNAIDLNQFMYEEQKRKNIRESYNIGNEILLGHVGRMDDNKNQIFLLKVLKKMIKEGYDVKLMLVGNGINFNFLKEEAKLMNIFDNVIFTGVKNNIDELMQGMDCFVFPSIYEGIPVTLIEAQTTGLPCVISDTISDDVILTQNIKKLSLNDSIEKWIEAILKTLNEKRNVDLNLITKKGYSIQETSKWMENFYEKNYK